MEHKPAVDIAGQSLKVLFIPFTTKGCNYHGLGLAPGKQRRTMGTGQHAHFAGDGPHFRKTASVKPLALVNNTGAHDPLFIGGKQIAHLGFTGIFILVKGGQDLFFQLVIPIFPGHLVGRGNHFLHTGGGKFFHPGLQFLVKGRGFNLTFFLAHLRPQIVLQGYEGLHSLMGEKNRLQHYILGQFPCPAFDHDNRLFGPGDHQIHVRLFQLCFCRIKDIVPINIAYPGSGNRSLPGNIGNGKGGRGAVHGQNVGIDFLVRRKNGYDDLGFAHIALGKKRPERSVDQTAGEHLFFTGTTDFTTEITSGNTAGGIHPFLILDGQG